MPRSAICRVLRFLSAVAVLGAIGSSSAPAGEMELPVLASWERTDLSFESSGDSVNLSATTNYKIARLRSPPLTMQSGKLVTVTAKIQTEYQSTVREHYLVWLELELVGAKGTLQTISSPTVIDTRPAQLVGTTVMVPAGVTSVRVNFCLQNKLWTVVKNKTTVREPALFVHDGGSGNDLKIAASSELQSVAGKRAARMIVSCDAPDGVVVKLAADRGRLSPCVVLQDGRAEALLEYADEDVGRSKVNAQLLDLTASTVVIDPQAAELRIAEVRANGKPGPALVQLVRNGKMIPGRYAPAMPGFFTEFPWSYELGPGIWQIRISRGPHFRAFERTLTVDSNRAVEISAVDLQPVVDLRERGWYGGDADGDVYHGEQIFTDVTAATAALIGRAMGLDWIGVGSWKKPAPTTWGEARQIMEQLSGPDLLFKYTDEKPKTTQGHACVVGLQRPDSDRFHWGWTGGGADVRNHQILKVLQDDGVATFANHPLRWWLSGGKFRTNLYSALPFDVCAAGVLDGVNINDRGEKSLQLWSLLLDHGYPVAATAGADFCLDRPGGPPPGLHRMYCYCPDGMTWPSLAEAVRRQHTVVSTGTILVASIDKRPPGTTFPTGHTYSVGIEGWARGDIPDHIERVELWSHNKPIVVKKIEPSRRVQHVDEVLEWKPVGPYDWVAVRLVSAKGWAMSSAFYATTPDWKAPRRPVSSEVEVKITGPCSENLSDGVLEVWSNAPDLLHATKLRSLPLQKAQKLTMPVTAVIVARLKDGRTAQTTVYEAAGMRSMVEFISGGERRDDALLNWDSYQAVLDACNNVRAEIHFK